MTTSSERQEIKKNFFGIEVNTILTSLALGAVLYGATELNSLSKAKAADTVLNEQIRSDVRELKTKLELIAEDRYSIREQLTRMEVRLTALEKSVNDSSREVQSK